MSIGRIAGRSAAVLIIALAAIQLVPVDRTNPAVEDEIPTTPAVRAILHRACWDCHSNQTVWPWYSRVAPVSWLVAHDVHEGRHELNLTAWNQYDARRRTRKWKEIGDEVSEGDMPPWQYVPMHAEARLSAADREALVAWARAAGGQGQG